MEKIISQEKQQITQLDNLYLINRKNLKVEGINEIISTSESYLNLKLKDTTLVINGENISIQKLDVDQGILEAEGKFTSFKYGATKNLFKRIFK